MGKHFFKRSKYGPMLLKSDFQADKVYDWGNNYIVKWDTQFLDLNTCNLISRDVFDAFNRKYCPQVVLSNHENCCFYIHDLRRIEMCESMRFRPILLHELSHGLVAYYYGHSTPAHGKEFMGFFMLLLNRWCKIPLSDMKQTADLNGIEYLFKYRPKKGFRVKRSLINPTKKEIKLTKRKMPGLALCQPLSTGGYKYVYDPNYWRLINE
jgi:hypothetical protein